VILLLPLPLLSLSITHTHRVPDGNSQLENKFHSQQSNKTSHKKNKNLTKNTRNECLECMPLEWKLWVHLITNRRLHNSLSRLCCRVNRNICLLGSPVKVFPLTGERCLSFTHTKGKHLSTGCCWCGVRISFPYGFQDTTVVYAGGLIPGIKSVCPTNSELGIWDQSVLVYLDQSIPVLGGSLIYGEPLVPVLKFKLEWFQFQT